MRGFVFLLMFLYSSNSWAFEETRQDFCSRFLSSIEFSMRTYIDEDKFADRLSKESQEGKITHSKFMELLKPTLKNQRENLEVIEGYSRVYEVYCKD